MAQVPDQVLSWLYNVLHEYRHSRRSYSDTARTLSVYPSLSPRTEVYTDEYGSSALLLTISGTLPVTFRGAAYKFPVKIFVPQTYPQEAPIVYVIPGQDMLVRPGQHVGVDGRVYHAYLRDWQNMWDRASLAEFLEYLQQVFAKEPPVISKSQQQQYYQRPMGGQTPQVQAGPGVGTGPPQLPPKPRIGDVDTAKKPDISTSQPPPRPPKPEEQYAGPLPPRASSSQRQRDGPPLPPLPHERSSSQRYTTGSQYPDGHVAPLRPPAQALVSFQQARTDQHGQPNVSSMLLQSPPQHQQYEQVRSNHNRSPVSPVSPIAVHSRPVDKRYSQPPPLPQQAQLSQAYLQQPHLNQTRSHTQTQATQHAGGYTQNLSREPQQYPPGQKYQQRRVPQPPKAPPPDLLSDPFDVALPGPNASGPPAPAPPIPPNPEKEHLLHALSTSLVQQAQAKVQQNLSAIVPLHAQASALQTAQQNLEAEIRQLQQLSSTLDSNEAILRRSISDCEHLVNAARRKPQPPIDEVLVASSLVAQQLWQTCADEASCREAMYVLQKAVDMGRISGPDFVRLMRALGREVFGKMALARKCARGMGLDVHGGHRFG